MFDQKLVEANYKIVETISGVFYYHLALAIDSKNRPICGSERWTMNTQLPIDSWGIRTHLNEKYCPNCTKLLDKAQESC